MARITFYVFTSNPRRVEAWRESEGPPTPFGVPDLSAFPAADLPKAVGRLADSVAARGLADEVSVIVDGLESGVRRASATPGGPKVLKSRAPSARLEMKRRGASGRVASWDVVLRGDAGEPLGIEDCLRGPRDEVLQEVEGIAKGLVEGGGYRRVEVFVDGKSEGHYSVSES
jgi:hypothetical protein